MIVDGAYSIGCGANNAICLWSKQNHFVPALVSSPPLFRYSKSVGSFASVDSLAHQTQRKGIAQRILHVPHLRIAGALDVLLDPDVNNFAAGFLAVFVKIIWSLRICCRVQSLLIMVAWLS